MRDSFAQGSDQQQAWFRSNLQIQEDACPSLLISAHRKVGGADFKRLPEKFQELSLPVTLVLRMASMDLDFCFCCVRHLVAVQYTSRAFQWNSLHMVLQSNLSATNFSTMNRLRDLSVERQADVILFMQNLTTINGCFIVDDFYDFAGSMDSRSWAFDFTPDLLHTFSLEMASDPNSDVMNFIRDQERRFF
ncbi:hypothetical protein Ddc_13318 [Ditylenchus destructor]|nr:hypothetical protein Ddc_13318 [Ditylenchus destructor]